MTVNLKSPLSGNSPTALLQKLGSMEQPTWLSSWTSLTSVEMPKYYQAPSLLHEDLLVRSLGIAHTDEKMGALSMYAGVQLTKTASDTPSPEFSVTLKRSRNHQSWTWKSRRSGIRQLVCPRPHPSLCSKWKMKLVSTLCVSMKTNRLKGHEQVIGGETFGRLLTWLPSVPCSQTMNTMHQANEFADVEDLSSSCNLTQKPSTNSSNKTLLSRHMLAEFLLRGGEMEQPDGSKRGHHGRSTNKDYTDKGIEPYLRHQRLLDQYWPSAWSQDPRSRPLLEGQETVLGSEVRSRWGDLLSFGPGSCCGRPWTFISQGMVSQAACHLARVLRKSGTHNSSRSVRI